LIAKGIITVSRIGGHLATKGKSLVSDEELKTVPTIIDLSLVYFSEPAPVIIRILKVNFFEFKHCQKSTPLLP
jgi:hypothetical protein